MKKLKVWDGPLRLFHWALATAFVISAYSAFQDKFGIYATQHLYAGTCTLALVIWRILWGFWGSETARFRNFVRKPHAVMTYLREKRRPDTPYAWMGHNPLGGWSVVAMLALLLVQAVLGLFSSDDLLFAGPFADAAGSLEDPITEIHETLGLILIGLVGLHLIAIIAYATRKVNLISPMIDGTRRALEGTKAPHMASPRLALALLAIVAAAVWFIVLA